MISLTASHTKLKTLNNYNKFNLFVAKRPPYIFLIHFINLKDRIGEGKKTP